jgi:hypothetical protein
MASAGYSGTPLPQKLGIKEAHKVALLGAPSELALGTLPTGVTVTRSLTGKAPRDGTAPPFGRAEGRGQAPSFDVLIVFVTRRADLVARIAACRPRMQPNAGLWIAWPKKASGVASEITEDTVREVALPTGLVDNKVCAIDAVWSGLRLVIRKELRT